MVQKYDRKLEGDVLVYKPVCRKFASATQVVAYPNFILTTWPESLARNFLEGVLVDIRRYDKQSPQPINTYKIVAENSGDCAYLDRILSGLNSKRVARKLGDKLSKIHVITAPEEFPEAIPPSVPNVAPVCSSTSKYSSSVRKCAYCGSVAKCDKACEHCGAP